MDNNPKAQVIERLKEAQNVLITVSNNPSVDQLSAALGLTLMLNKLDKHATAVFSGQVPSTIEFLKPEDTLEQNTDSLRDFIISLDKAKADKLRYKVEEDFVKIFITPYKTSLSEQDLNFSQGDFNVDVVVALGVDQREHIDQAVIEHGRILHDATIIGVMAGEAPIDVGGINWQDSAASSLCEMLVSISEAFQKGLLDGQMATAFLTGIVAETDRFSNDKTSPKVMTMSAQLMAAGANQQLIATELTVPPEVEDVPSDLPPPSDLDDSNQSAIDEVEITNEEEGVLSLHEEHMAEQAMNSNQPGPAYEPPMSADRLREDQIHIDEHGTLHHADDIAKIVQDVQLTSRTSLAHEKVIQPLDDDDATDAPSQSLNGYMTEPPQMGGTLTASTQEEDTYEPNVDPLSMIPQSAFPAPEFPSTQSPLVSVQDDAESVSPTAIESTTSPHLASDGDTGIDKPLGPQVSGDSTLEDIEKSVEAFTGEEVHKVAQESEAVPDADAARRAVLDAMSANGGYDALRPEPTQANGAQLFGDNLNTPTDQPLESVSPPPPIVPPPFPLQDENQNQ